MRDEFSDPIKRVLSQRSGARCANPSCRALTSAPHTATNRAVNIGVAAHIAAAALGGPRYDSQMSALERSAAENGIWLCQNCAKLIDSDVDRFPTLLLRKWKADTELEAHKMLGAPVRSQEPDAAPELQIARTLELREKMRGDFLYPANERKVRGSTNFPYQKFKHTEAIVRATDDSLYPEIDSTRSPSGWFKVELYDFYHNGLLVICNLSRGVTDERGNWAILAHGAPFDSGRFREIKVWHLGKIPYSAIRIYDLDGDEYYNFPHIWCTFTPGIGPYEGFTYAMLGDTFDWPLDSAKRLQADDVV